MAFLKKPRDLPNLMLCGNPLPWTDGCKHLGINLENKINGCEHDMRTKNAQYIGKNIEINQEFQFVHPSTKIRVNSIYNSSYYGSPLWNLFGSGAFSIQSSYNKSVKVMLDLPYETHRSLIEPLTGEKHVKLVLIKRFLGFMDKIRNSEKIALKMLQLEAMRDVRSVTGSNYRNVMLLLGKSRVEDVKLEDSTSLTYHTLDPSEAWKVSSIKEIINTKAGMLEVPGFQTEELEEILHHLCTS